MREIDITHMRNYKEALLLTPLNTNGFKSRLSGLRLVGMSETGGGSASRNNMFLTT